MTTTLTTTTSDDRASENEWIDGNTSIDVASTCAELPRDTSAGALSGYLSRRLQSLSGLFGRTARVGTLTLLDQAIVSATSFLTTVVLGRVCGPSQLAAYSVGLSLFFLAQSVLQSIVLAPFTVNVNRSRSRNQTRYAGASMMQMLGLASLAVAGLVLWGWLALVGLTENILQGAIWGLAAAFPFLILREFARRFAFAHFDAVRALCLDGLVALVQLSGLFLLAAFGWLSSVSAFLLIGFACALAAGAWLAVSRYQFRFRARTNRAALKRNWRFGRWILAGQITAQLNSDVIMLWLLVWYLGDNAAGVFAACVSIVFFSNPFVLGISNILTPRIAQTMKYGGHAELLRVVHKVAVLMGSAMGLFCIAMFLAGGVLIQALFGPEYAGHDATILALAVGMAIRSIGVPISFGLWTIDRPDSAFVANVIGLVVTVTVAAALLSSHGILGAAMATAAGRLAALGVRYLALRHYTSRISLEAV
jgi:O-antigen/teichoic acid export membrane protein